MDAAVRDLQTLFDMGVTGALSDGRLLDRFVERREEAVFEAIIRRHGPMVCGVCRRVLRDHHDAEDAFQATFLVLARKSASIVPREKLGNWLYGVAYQTAMKARSQRTKRRGREAQVSDMPEPVAATHDPRNELAESLDRELSRLPEKYRIPVVLCDLEGRNHREAADQLGWPIGTVSSRLSRARALLARRLSRRGVSLSAGTLATLLAQESASAGMPTRLIGQTAQAASLFAAGGAVTAGMVPVQVAALTREVMKIMLFSKIKIAAIVLAASALVVGGTGLVYRAQGGQLVSQEATPGATGRDQGDDDPFVAKRPDEPKGKAAESISPATNDLASPIERQVPPKLTGDLPPEQAPPQEPEPRPSHSPPEQAPPQEPDLLLGSEPPPPRPTTGQEPPQEDPLSELIMAGDHTPEQLERAKAVIESMITLEKEVRGKSPEELDTMIQARAGALEKARWEIRMMDAQLRRLRAIKQTTYGPVPDDAPPRSDPFTVN